MHTFKDKTGRAWTIDITVDEIARVKASLKLDLKEMLVNPEIYNRLADDPEQLCNLIYVLCQPQATEAGIDDVTFGKSMNGLAIYEATGAFLKEMADFFQYCGKKEVYLKVIEKTNTLQDKTNDLLMERLAAVNLDEFIQQAISKETSGDSPELPASTQAP